MAATAKSPVDYEVLKKTVKKLLGIIDEKDDGSYMFETIEEMNNAIEAGKVKDGGTIYVKENIVDADTTYY